MAKKQQQYNDGVLSVYAVENIAEDGDMPKTGLALKQGGLRYEEQIVGVTRFWAAMQSKTKIERVLRTPRIDSVSTNDISIPIDGKQYTIKQVQYPPDVEPPSMDLSLERSEVPYDIKTS